jgi:hypothetical protein
MKEPTKRGARKQARALDTSVALKRGTDETRTPKEPEMEHLLIPLGFIQAAVTVADQVPKDAVAVQRGILIHQKDNGHARVVGYAPGVGGRIFVGAFPVPGKAPTWLKPGLLLARDNLKAQLAMIAKMGGKNDSSQPMAMVSYKKGEPRASLSDEARGDQGMPSMVFSVAAAQHVEQLAVYEEKFQASSFVDLDTEGEAKAKPDWDPVGFNSQHMKHCTEIAKLLERQVPKEQRENGIIIRTFSSGEASAPRVFDFDGVPGAVLMVAGNEIVQRAVPLQTARILAPATKLTIAALRAHATRNRAWADEATDERVKAQFLAKEQEFLARIADIMARVPGGDGKVQLPAPAKTVPQITHLASEDEEEGTDDGDLGEC